MTSLCCCFFPSNDQIHEMHTEFRKESCTRMTDETRYQRLSSYSEPRDSGKLQSLPRRLRNKSRSSTFECHVFSDSESSGGEGFLDNENCYRSNQERPSQAYLCKLSRSQFSDDDSDSCSDPEQEIASTSLTSKKVNPFDRHASTVFDVRVPPGSIGVLMSNSVNGVTVEGFCPLPDGSKGVLEQCGRVKRGTRLCAINGNDVSLAPINQAVHLLQQTSHVPRILSFKNERGPEVDYDDL